MKTNAICAAKRPGLFFKKRPTQFVCASPERGPGGLWTKKNKTNKGLWTGKKQNIKINKQPKTLRPLD